MEVKAARNHLCVNDGLVNHLFKANQHTESLIYFVTKHNL